MAPCTGPAPWLRPGMARRAPGGKGLHDRPSTPLMRQICCRHKVALIPHQESSLSTWCRVRLIVVFHANQGHLEAGSILGNGPSTVSCCASLAARHLNAQGGKRVVFLNQVTTKHDVASPIFLAAVTDPVATHGKAQHRSPDP